MGEQMASARDDLGAEESLKPDSDVSRSNLSVASNEQINVIMKEEQLDFAYENIEKGSNKSFKADDD